jgi:hypothetical protein
MRVEEGSGEGTTPASGAGASAPGSHDDPSSEQTRSFDQESDLPPLSDDVKAAIEDGKTYAAAEIAFQKSRAAWTGNRVKYIAVFAIFALGFVHLALIAMVVGAVIALSQIIDPWAATGIVTLALLLGAAILGLLIKAKIGDISSAFAKEEPGSPKDEPS